MAPPPLRAGGSRVVTKTVTRQFTPPPPAFTPSMQSGKPLAPAPGERQRSWEARAFPCERSFMRTLLHCPGCFSFTLYVDCYQHSHLFDAAQLVWPFQEAPPCGPPPPREQRRPHPSRCPEGGGRPRRSGERHLRPRPRPHCSSSSLPRPQPPLSPHPQRYYGHPHPHHHQR